MGLIWYLCYEPGPVLIAFFLDFRWVLCHVHTPTTFRFTYIVPYYEVLCTDPVSSDFPTALLTLLDSSTYCIYNKMFWPRFWLGRRSVYREISLYSFVTALLKSNEASMKFLAVNKNCHGTVYLLAIVFSILHLTCAAWFLIIWNYPFQIVIHTVLLTQSGRLNMIWPWTNTATANIIKASASTVNSFALLTSSWVT
jgi:hypothetical protein